MKYLFLLTVLTFIIFIPVSVIGQLPVIEEAIKLYEQGKYSESIRALETASRNDDLKDDAKLWSYLGLAYLKNDEIKKARKPSEKAVKLEPQNAVFRTNLSYVYLMNGQINKSQSEAETSIQIDPKQTMAYYLMGIGHLWEGDPDTAETYAEKILANDAAFPQGYLLKSDVFVELLGKRVAAGSSIKEEVDFLKKSVDVLERGLQNSSTAAGRKMLADKLEGMKAFYSHYSKDRSMHPAVPPVPEPGVTPFKILTKPRAVYTDNARSAGKSGIVRLALLLGADGKIKHILKIKGIGYGLDEQAINAARKITFEPKMKDGKQVSTVVTVEYGFTIY